MDAQLEDQGTPPAIGNSSSPKKSVKSSGRRSAQKRVVSVPVPETEGMRPKAGGGETSPPSDSWTWRKYGQKPIKGSPYPRGYYRCSSSKGCPARKQVERSRTDPTVFIVTYSFDHNHPWPLPRSHHRHHHSSPVTASSHEPKPDAEPSPSELASDPEEKFSGLIVEETSLMIPDDFRWPSASSGASVDDGLLYGTLCGSLTADDDCDKFSSSGGSGEAMDEEEDALFAGLGELPECSVVFRRGFLDRPMRGADEAKRCGMEADDSAAAAASCCGGAAL